jgi:hypothetical protein
LDASRRDSKNEPKATEPLERSQVARTARHPALRSRARRGARASAWDRSSGPVTLAFQLGAACPSHERRIRR